MSEWVYRDCPTCVQVDELEPEDSTNPVDWYGTLHEPIVRCCDCKYMETRGLRCYCAAHAGGYPEVSLDDFCSFGERRDA